MWLKMNDDIISNIKETVKKRKENFNDLKKIAKNRIKQIKKIRKKVGTKDLIRKKDLNIDMIYRSEELLPFTKEYWWFWFIDGNKQIVITFGRNYNDFKVNKKTVKKSKENEKECFVVAWYFDGKKKKKIFNTVKKFITGENFVKSMDGDIILTGKYPNYEIKISKNKETVFQGKMTKNKNGYNISSEKKTVFSFDILNIFSNLRGKLNGKKFHGLSEMQKVVVLTPFLPWNWTRVVCKKGWITCFVPYLNVSNLKQPIFTKVRITIGKKKYEFNNIEIIKAADEKRWILKNNDLFILLEAYEKDHFELQNIGTHYYIEHLVELKDFVMKKNGKTYTMKDIGTGYGMLEDAYGYVI